MGWRDRDYRSAEDGPLPWSITRPPPATLVLLLAHAAAFVAVLVVVRPEQPGPLAYARLGAAPHPLAIALHPFATVSVLTILITIWALWSLGGRLERERGPGCVLVNYAVGTLCAGAGFFLVARVRPALAGHPLDWPAGAVAAYCFQVWSQHRYAPVQIFGRESSLGRVYGIGAALVLIIVLALHGVAAFAWLVGLLAAVAGAALLVRYSPARWGGAEVTWGTSASRWGTLGFGALARRWRKWWWRARARRRATPQHGIPDDDEVDAILAKISRDGLDSLTARERTRLEAARQARLRQSSR